MSTFTIFCANLEKKWALVCDTFRIGHLILTFLLYKNLKRLNHFSIHTLKFKAVVMSFIRNVTGACATFCILFRPVSIVTASAIIKNNGWCHKHMTNTYRN